MKEKYSWSDLIKIGLWYIFYFLTSFVLLLSTFVILKKLLHRLNTTTTIQDLVFRLVAGLPLLMFHIQPHPWLYFYKLANINKKLPVNIILVLISPKLKGEVKIQLIVKKKRSSWAFFANNFELKIPMGGKIQYKF